VSAYLVMCRCASFAACVSRATAACRAGGSLCREAMAMGTAVMHGALGATVMHLVCSAARVGQNRIYTPYIRINIWFWPILSTALHVRNRLSCACKA
jgi:hypothetical protein